MPIPSTLRHFCPEGKDERVTLVKLMPGYKHTKYEGTYLNGVTEQDIAKLFFHPYFGGREIKMKDGKFSVIRHDD